MFLNIFLSIIAHRFLLVFMSAVLILVAVTIFTKTKKKTAFGRFAAIFMILSLLNIFFGGQFSNQLIYKYGERGTGMILSHSETGDLYNKEPIVGYEVVLKKADGSTVDTHFESWDFNMYSAPEGNYVYPKDGEEFAVSYLPQNPDLFVILTGQSSDYSSALNCEKLNVAMKEAQQKMDFAKENKAYQEAYAAAKKAYKESACEEKNTNTKMIQDEEVPTPSERSGLEPTNG